MEQVAPPPLQANRWFKSRVNEGLCDKLNAVICVCSHYGSFQSHLGRKSSSTEEKWTFSFVISGFCCKSPQQR